MLIVVSGSSHSGPDQAQIDKGIELAKDLLAVVREKHAEARQALESGQFGSGGNQQQMYGGQMRYDQQQQGGQPYAYQVSWRPFEGAGLFAAMRSTSSLFSRRLADPCSVLAAEPVRSRPHCSSPAWRGACRASGCFVRDARSRRRRSDERHVDGSVHSVVEHARRREQGVLHAVRSLFLAFLPSTRDVSLTRLRTQILRRLRPVRRQPVRLRRHDRPNPRSSIRRPSPSAFERASPSSAR